jgi:hypothetical protein
MNSASYRNVTLNTVANIIAVGVKIRVKYKAVLH